MVAEMASIPLLLISCSRRDRGASAVLAMLTREIRSKWEVMSLDPQAPNAVEAHVEMVEVSYVVSVKSFAALIELHPVATTSLISSSNLRRIHRDNLHHLRCPPAHFVREERHLYRLLSRCIHLRLLHLRLLLLCFSLLRRPRSLDSLRTPFLKPLRHSHLHLHQLYRWHLCIRYL